MADSKQYLRILGYLVTVGLHLSVISNLFFGAESKDERVKVFRSNRPRYLTGWNMFLQLVHAVLGLCCEYLLIKNAGVKKYMLPKHLRGVRDSLFTNIVFPGSMVVATLFWTLFNYDRELVFPLFLDQIIPNVFNHIIHTLIVPLALYEVLLQPRYEPKTHVWNCMHIALHISAYGSVLVFTYYEKGMWLYPILEKLELPYFIGFFAIVIILSYFYYFLQWRIARLVWGEKSAISSRISQKSKKIQ